MEIDIDFNAKDSLGWTQIMKANGHNQVVKLVKNETFRMISKLYDAWFLWILKVLAKCIVE